MIKEPFSLLFYAMEISQGNEENSCPRLPNKREKVIHNSSTAETLETTRNQMGFGNFLG
jgi:hypothetical protein